MAAARRAALPRADPAAPALPQTSMLLLPVFYGAVIHNVQDSRMFKRAPLGLPLAKTRCEGAGGAVGGGVLSAICAADA